MLRFLHHFQEWMDVNLAWNETEYGNVQDVRIPPSSLWKPDILMYNRLVAIPQILNFYILSLWRTLT